MRVDTLVLFLTLEEMLLTFHDEYDVSCGPVIYGLYYVEVSSFYPHLPKSSVFHKWMLNFVKNFFYTYCDDHMVFIFAIVSVVY